MIYLGGMALFSACKEMMGKEESYATGRGYSPLMSSSCLFIWAIGSVAAQY